MAPIGPYEIIYFLYIIISYIVRAVKWIWWSRGVAFIGKAITKIFGLIFFCIATVIKYIFIVCGIILNSKPALWLGAMFVKFMELDFMIVVNDIVTINFFDLLFYLEHDCDQSKFQSTLAMSFALTFLFLWFVLFCWLDNVGHSRSVWMVWWGLFVPYAILQIWRLTETNIIFMYIYCYIMYWEAWNPYIEIIVLHFEQNTCERVPFYLYTFEEETAELNLEFKPMIDDYKRLVIGSIEFYLDKLKEDLDFYNKFFKSRDVVIRKIERKILILEDELKRQNLFISNLEGFIEEILKDKKPVHPLKIFGAESQMYRQWKMCKKVIKRCSIDRFAPSPSWWEFWKF